MCVFAECTEALGLESGDIDDCQITCSSALDSATDCSHARLHGTSGWTPAVRGTPFREHEYLQVVTSQSQAMQFCSLAQC